ncbi:MAG TPA: hypothetical protein VL133_03015 [Devosia sp.]|nr:hypothetical protein [Devosia sp.]
MQRLMFSAALTVEGSMRKSIQIVVAAALGFTSVAAISLQDANTSQAVARNSECNIKGNVSTRGERIYHVPGQEYYDDTRISASHGERWFCSEQEAREAGWRRSKV